MRISDWSSDVCSSDLAAAEGFSATLVGAARSRIGDAADAAITISHQVHGAIGFKIGRASCRERVCPVRVDLGGRRIIKKKNKTTSNHHDISTRHTNSQTTPYQQINQLKRQKET